MRTIDNRIKSINARLTTVKATLGVDSNLYQQLASALFRHAPTQVVTKDKAIRLSRSKNANITDAQLTLIEDYFKEHTLVKEKQKLRAIAKEAGMKQKITYPMYKQLAGAVRKIDTNFQMMMSAIYTFELDEVETEIIDDIRGKGKKSYEQLFKAMKIYERHKNDKIFAHPASIPQAVYGYPSNK